jgi:cytoplasmic iron level regulating protein YaaA (DUF328/UPF0246 family)
LFILLPPSETKRPGGGGLSLATDWKLSFPELDETRNQLADALRDLAADPVAATKALKLGPTQQDEVGVNAELFDSPTMPALERFTGVLYDAVDIDTIDRRGREFLNSRVLIQSALFGLVRATDHIPAYRLSFDSRLPGIPSLKKLWATTSQHVLNDHAGLILDLRSEGYAALTPLPERDNAYFVRAVGRTPDGTLRQLNHFNKKGKGVFVRALGHSFPHWVRNQSDEYSDVSASGFSIENVDTLLLWAQTYGVDLSRTNHPHVLQLVINEADYPPINARAKVTGN